MNKPAKFFFLTSIFLLHSISLFAKNKIVNVVPQPKKIELTNHNFEILNQNISVIYYGEKNQPIEIALEDLKKISKEFCGANLLKDPKINKKIIIGLYNVDEKFNSLVNSSNLQYEERIGSEGYKLLVDSDKIIIAAIDQTGLFYGIQTLKQLMRAIADDYIPGLVITDWSSFKYRAVMDDISRGPIPNLNYMKYQIRRLSELKINTLLHYVEHVVKTVSHPEFAPPDGSYTIEEWKEISDYALLYNITVIGGFQSFGHFQKILETPEYAHLGESGSLISPVKEESYEFLENIFKEMIPAFHTEFFNINCDETFDLGKGESKNLVDSLGYAEVYFMHIKRLYDILKKYNKRVIMWGDILMQYPSILEKLPKDILIGTWDYDARETFENFINPFKESGHELWVVPGVLNTRSIYPDFNEAFQNIKTFVEEGYEAEASGVLVCFWDDGGTGLFSNDWYGAAYGAEKSWNSGSDDSSFDLRYSKGSLRDNDVKFIKAIKKVNELRLLELTDGMTDRFLFTNIVPEKGKDIRISTADLLKASDIIKEAELLLNSSSINNYSEDRDYLEFINDLYEILINERFDILKAAESYRKAEVQIKIDPYEAREKIIRSLELVSSIIKNQQYLKNRFELLWLKENHTYALDWITDKYEGKINDFISIRNQLLESVKKLDSSQPIISIDQVGLDISRLPGKYFTEWLMINPIPNKDNSLISSVDYLDEMGGESNAIPKVTQEFYFDENKFRWRRVVSPEQDIVNLNEIFPDTDHGAVMYAFANITIDEIRDVKAMVGFSEKIEVFINGKSIFRKGGGKLSPDTESFMIRLPKGKNNLMLKITKLNNDWGFTFRLPDSDVRNHKNRYRIIE